MKNLVIDATANTPDVFFDASKNILSFKGKSLPENSIGFYGIIDVYINEYIIRYKTQPLTIMIDLIYINSASNKSLFLLIKKCQREIENIRVIWRYMEEDEDMKELGMDFERTLGINFKYETYI